MEHLRRHPVLGADDWKLVNVVAVLHFDTQAQVANLHRAVDLHENVGALEIAMHQSQAVEILEALENLMRHRT